MQEEKDTVYPRILSAVTVYEPEDGDRVLKNQNGVDVVGPGIGAGVGVGVSMVPLTRATYAL